MKRTIAVLEFRLLLVADEEGRSFSPVRRTRVFAGLARATPPLLFASDRGGHLHGLRPRLLSRESSLPTRSRGRATRGEHRFIQLLSLSIYHKQRIPKQ